MRFFTYSYHFLGFKIFVCFPLKRVRTAIFRPTALFSADGSMQITPPKKKRDGFNSQNAKDFNFFIAYDTASGTVKDPCKRNRLNLCVGGSMK